MKRKSTGYLVFNKVYRSSFAGCPARPRAGRVGIKHSTRYLSIAMSGLVQYNNLYFLTCTIVNWRNVLKTEENKQILLDGFSFLVADKRVVIYAFVILDNHFHLILETIPPHNPIRVKHSLLSYT